jgi:hypothetical protein
MVVKAYGQRTIISLDSRRRPVVSFTLLPLAALEKEIGTPDYEAVRGSRSVWTFRR